MSEQLKLGQLITDEQNRDAVHIAVAPVTAATLLYPGQHIGFIQKGTDRVNQCDNPIGTVDPFLKCPVHMGQKFWMFLYPGSVKGLRHEWAHPAFESNQAPAVSDRSASEKWMRAWAAKHMGIDYYSSESDVLVTEDDAFKSAIKAGFDHHVGRFEDARDHIDDMWWYHWEKITGEKGDREVFFSCGC